MILTPLLKVILALVIIGIVLWLVNTYLPMDAKIKQILNVIVVVFAIIWALISLFSVGGFGSIRLP
ncbi:MAG: Thivi_2564 family membrane protein [Pseudomonadota bacterium]|nr:Thivi_2564 family membrane protein [Pseudomonadota bacterium]